MESASRTVIYPNIQAYSIKPLAVLVIQCELRKVEGESFGKQMFLRAGKMSEILIWTLTRGSGQVTHKKTSIA